MKNSTLQCDLAILPSSAVFLNGGVFSPRGSHQLALLAKHFNVPVVVCAQTYKFVDLVSFIYIFFKVAF